MDLSVVFLNKLQHQREMGKEGRWERRGNGEGGKNMPRALAKELHGFCDADANSLPKK